MVFKAVFLYRRKMTIKGTRLLGIVMDTSRAHIILKRVSYSPIPLKKGIVNFVEY